MLGAVILLAAFGLMMLASASRSRAMVRFDDPYFFVIRQAIWMVLGLVAAGVVARVDYHWYRRFSWILLAVALMGLILVFAPGIGIKRGGSNRWIGVGGLRFQPSEFAKLAMISGLAAWYAVRPQRIPTFLNGAVKPFVIIGLLAGLVFLEPDYGTAALLAATGVGVMFVAGVRFLYLGLFSLAGLCAFVLAVLHNPHRMTRTLAFIMPDRHPDLAYQLGQSKDAFSLGGLFGVGLGESIQKHFYLPEAHTDFIFAIIGEELGLLATGSVVLLYFVVFLCALKISRQAPDRFGRLLGTGLALLLSLQAAFNIAVVTGLLPTKGITLPFISYGGSSLLTSMILIGVLVNIARHATPEYGDRHTRFIRNQSLDVDMH